MCTVCALLRLVTMRPMTTANLMEQNMNFTSARRFALPILLAGALLGLSPAATAAPPVKGDPPADFPDNLRLPAGTACSGFDLLLQATGSNATVRTFLDKSGKPIRIFSGGRGFTLTYTRLDSEGAPVRSITIRPTGSVRNTVLNPDGSQTITETGTAGLIMFPTDKPAGPTTTQYNGRIVYKVENPGPDNVTTLLSTTGTSRDICAELGA